MTESCAGWDVSVDDARPIDPRELAPLARDCEAAGVARLAWNGAVALERAQPVQRMGPAHVVPPPGAFLQATAHGQAALLAAVRAALGEVATHGGRIADLFAGCGTFSLPLATAAEVHAVEAEAAMLDALDRGWRAAAGRGAGLRRITVEPRDLFRRPLAAAELAGIDAVVIDPPRAGAEAQARALAESAVPKLAAVSCNPASFARDAAILVQGGYRLDRLWVVDQFRWSPHVELAAGFSRR